jgi:hypothetical protein
MTQQSRTGHSSRAGDTLGQNRAGQDTVAGQETR